MKGGPKFEEGMVVGGDFPFGSGSRWRQVALGVAVGGDEWLWEWQ